MMAINDAWLTMTPVADDRQLAQYRAALGPVEPVGRTAMVARAAAELRAGLTSLLGSEEERSGPPVWVGLWADLAADPRMAKWLGERATPAAGVPGDAFTITRAPSGAGTVVASATAVGTLYGAFRLLSTVRRQQPVDEACGQSAPAAPLRMLDHWDNVDGSIERGYAGRSLFFRDGHVRDDGGARERMGAYARLLASIGVNAVALNNVNVNEAAGRLAADPRLTEMASVAILFRAYGIRLYLSVDFLNPLRLGGLPTADPREAAVQGFWRELARRVWTAIPDLGGFLVKADSEFREGPASFGRTQADGANCLGEAVEPFGGQVLWRTFAYPMQDWRNREQDRAKAAFDLFQPLDGQFRSNVMLQTKHGPIDFQVREPVSPLLGSLRKTRQCLELQITQEYTGQQRHLFYWAPAWRDVLDTPVGPDGERVADLVARQGLVGVANVGDAANWTGHDLAQANLYAFGRLAWDPSADPRTLAREWSEMTFGGGAPSVLIDTVSDILMDSAVVYEQYVAPLGVGFMVNPGHHYGPNPDGYEYQHWGTYHHADSVGVGRDRTEATGTNFVSQYPPALQALYEDPATCPEELVLFFHHLPYTYRLRSGRSLIQGIYDQHFAGAAGAEALWARWRTLADLRLDSELYARVEARLAQQTRDAAEWRDVINTYFYRRTHRPDADGRFIAP